ncbi:MAG: ABC transporter permease [Actinomycetota bacterium]
MANAPDRGLTDLTAGSSVRSYLSEMWARREFAVVVPANDIRVQNMDTALGQLWHVVNPTLMVAVYYLIFGVVLDTDRGVDNYLGFLVVGVLLFQLSQRIIQDGSMVMGRNEGLIRSIQFPRALLPLSTANGQTIAFVPALLVLIVTLFITGETPALRWLVLVPILVLQYLVNVGGALCAARLGNGFRDLGQILPHLFRLLFYVSGVIFSVEAFVTDPFWRQLFAINPFYDIVAVARWAMLGLPVGAEVVVGLLAWAAALPVFGFAYFRRAELRYGS